jgi:hypothetical protein
VEQLLDKGCCFKAIIIHSKDLMERCLSVDDWWRRCCTMPEEWALSDEDVILERI